MATWVFCLFGAFLGLSSGTNKNVRILASKKVLNQAFIVDSDLLIEYTIHNLGSDPLINVTIFDVVPEHDFRVVAGSLLAKIPYIPPQHNVTHCVVLVPLRTGLANITAASVVYLDEKGPVSHLTSEPREIRILPKSESHLMDWVTLLVLTLPSTAAPFLLWWISKTKYESLGKIKTKL